MSERVSTLIVPVDGSPQACRGAERAGELASLLGAQLQLLHVMPPAPAELSDLPGNRTPDTDADIAGQRQVADDALSTARNALQQGIRDAAGAVILDDIAHHGDPTRVIVEHAEATGDAMVVMGARGLGGFRKLFLGSVSDAIVHNAPCPVMVVHDNDHPSNRSGIRHVLLPVDGSTGGDRAVRLAGQIAVAAGATVHLLFAYPRHPADVQGAAGVMGEAGAYTDQMVESFIGAGREEAAHVFARARNGLGEGGLEVSEHQLASGAPAEAILEFASGRTEPSIIVMGRRGISRWQERLIGSVSHTVINGASCPVVVVG